MRSHLVAGARNWLLSAILTVGLAASGGIRRTAGHPSASIRLRREVASCLGDNHVRVCRVLCGGDTRIILLSRARH